MQVSAGARHTLALAANGKLWGCGDASMGQLGPQCTGSVLSPCRLDVGAGPGTGAVFACAAGHHSMAWLGRLPGPLQEGALPELSVKRRQHAQCFQVGVGQGQAWAQELCVHALWDTTAWPGSAGCLDPCKKVQPLHPLGGSRIAACQAQCRVQFGGQLASGAACSWCTSAFALSVDM